MPDWTSERVLRAAAAWVWVPPDADEVRTDDYQLIRYADHFAQPTQVAWSRTQRPLDEVIDQVFRQVRDWGRSAVYWWTSPATSPRDTESVLLERGATVAEIVHVLAYDMGAGLPTVDTPDDVRVELVRDEPAYRALQLVEAQVWEAPYPDDDRLARGLREAQADLADRSGFRVVGWIGDEPVAFGGCSLVDEIARLWGAGTRAAWQHRGAYRAVLRERLRLARDSGATLALVKGRVETSAPILKRIGFTSYGEERCYKLPAG
jgi:Acetyltransferase (GNAT) family